MIGNERDFFVTSAHVPHPITLHDFRWSDYARAAPIRQAKLLPGNLMVFWYGRPTCPTTLICYQVPLRPGVPARSAIEWPAIGIFSNIVGTDIHIVDNLSLADPLGSHLELTIRGRKGHEKIVPEAWVVARFADPTAPLRTGGPGAAEVTAARAALGCGDIPELLASVSEPMTPSRFGDNLLDAFRFYGLRIPPDPQLARTDLCGDLVLAKAPCPQAISWERAVAAVGEPANVRGPVVDVQQIGAGPDAVLVIGAQGKFGVVLRGSTKASPLASLQARYLGKTVCVRGVPIAFQGAAVIVAEFPGSVAVSP